MQRAAIPSEKDSGQKDTFVCRLHAFYPDPARKENEFPVSVTLIDRACFCLKKRKTQFQHFNPLQVLGIEVKHERTRIVCSMLSVSGDDRKSGRVTGGVCQRKRRERTSKK